MTVGLVMTSYDGVEWTWRPTPWDTISGQVAAAIAANGYLVVESSGDPGAPSFMTSSNGTTWTSGASPVGEGGTQVVSMGPNGWAAMLNGALSTSTDGVTWTAQSCPFNYSTATTPTTSMSGLFYNSGRLFAFGQTPVGSVNQNVAWSDVPLTGSWTFTTTNNYPPNPASGYLIGSNCMAQVQGSASGAPLLLLCWGYTLNETTNQYTTVEGTFTSTDNGAIWTQIAANDPFAGVNGGNLVYGNQEGLWVSILSPLVGSAGIYTTSQQYPYNWALFTPPPTTTFVPVGLAVNPNGSLFVALGNGHTSANLPFVILTSKDGFTWIQQKSPLDVNQVANYGGGVVWAPDQNLWVACLGRAVYNPVSYAHWEVGILAW